ncbi:ribosomal RNA-processing protein 7-domain-containing protein [Alternaria rosae]|uniref:ribosomal RNA-processing protein 7-domain-containing protein n=1 Tax=Alternaria rosae TaxID=1187941 RepID=UPI001E8D0CFD|nr:ribosomal RNA-processing protein 7-domain-containing protein [Alternaria rosae]KAH6878619.1 ribosomal RNA-processing protein 7-domain-containing protein [Alternaria rosae]
MAPEAPPKTKKSKATPKTVADFTVLPLTLPTLSGIPAHCNDAKHYIYVKPHAPSIPTADDERSLFIANTPVDASERNIRALFQEQLGGSMVERVEFDASVPAQPMHKRWKSDKPVAQDDSVTSRGKKRKRTDDAAVIAEGVVEDAESALPRLWNSEVRKSGSGAVVVFVDKKSTRGALKEIQKAVKEGRSISWKGGEGLGVERYKSHNTLIYPTPTLLQASLNAYLTQFNALETARNRIRKTSRSVPDEEGFMTVTRGGRVGPARLEEAEKKKAELDERKRNHRATDDFYRFQNRERRKEAEGLLKRKFEEDRRRVEGMRERRGRVRPET